MPPVLTHLLHPLLLALVTRPPRPGAEDATDSHVAAGAGIAVVVALALALDAWLVWRRLSRRFDPPR
jgi:hypothetical protein